MFCEFISLESDLLHRGKILKVSEEAELLKQILLPCRSCLLTQIVLRFTAV